jgi:hypothetical protein
VSDYATITQIKSRLLPNSYDSSTDTAIGDIITAASRLIDSYLKVENDFFAVAAVSASTKVVYGRGSDRLRLPPFTGSIVAADLTVPSGYTKPVFTVVDGWFTIPAPASLGFGVVGNAPEYNPYLYSWLENVPYTISARWGWAVTPQDITEACIQIVVRLFRGRDDAYVGVITNDNGQAFEKAIPAGSKMILDEWARKLIRMGILET